MSPSEPSLRPPGDEELERYFRIVRSEGIYPIPGNLRFLARALFEGVPIGGRSVLEIGGGNGSLSFYAACAGARRVVCLEPQAAGSSDRNRRQFDVLAARLQRPEVVLVRESIQEFDPRGERFDILMLNASINHLDEEACVRLRDDAASRDRYRALFRKMAAMIPPGGQLVATDCSRYNALGSIGLRNPLARFIDWRKHQEPRLWARLLEEAGFGSPRIGWLSLSALRAPGRFLFGNVVGAFFLGGPFRLVMTRG
jgi:SAM-dependent methyltransferase